jgi:uncharacterized protein YndB with AHSA1/START domain
MSERSVIHSTFTLEHIYPAPPARVFAAWSDRGAKARWFSTPAADYALDFRVGGREVNVARHNDRVLTFESWYRDILDVQRIVYTSTLSADEILATVSLTTVELSPTGEGETRLVLTEQGAFLDGHEQPEWRERGTRDWLGALGDHLRATSTLA